MTPNDERERAGEPPREPVSGSDEKPPKRGPAMASGGELAGAGFQFAASVLLLLFAGRWLDGRLGTSPWLLLLGTLAGAAVGFYTMYRTLTKAQARGRRGQGRE